MPIELADSPPPPPRGAPARPRLLVGNIPPGRIGSVIEIGDNRRAPVQIQSVPDCYDGGRLGRPGEVAAGPLNRQNENPLVG